MTSPNDTLRAVRMSMLMSQEDFAEALQTAGQRSGKRIDISKRTVQRWEAGAITAPRPPYAKALQALTGLPLESLGFPIGADRMLVEDGRGGHDLEVRIPPVAQTSPQSARGNYSGIWLSRYEYYSSGRTSAFDAQHAAVVLHHGDRLTVRSIAGSSDTGSNMNMALELNGTVATGSWVEETSPKGYYRGARYHGAIQLMVDPTGRRMSGKWVGFGKDGDVNTGPWTLTFQEASVSRDAIARYSKPVK